MIETSGVIEKEQGNGFYLVTLEQPEGHQCLCRAAGKLTKFRIKLIEKIFNLYKKFDFINYLKLTIIKICLCNFFRIL